MFTEGKTRFLCVAVTCLQHVGWGGLREDGQVFCADLTGVDTHLLAWQSSQGVKATWCHHPKHWELFTMPIFAGEHQQDFP